MSVVRKQKDTSFKNTLFVDPKEQTFDQLLSTVLASDVLHGLISYASFVKLLPLHRSFHHLTKVKLYHVDIDHVVFLKYSMNLVSLTIDRGEMNGKTGLQLDLSGLSDITNIKELHLVNVHNPRLLGFIRGLKQLKILELNQCTFGPDERDVDIAIGSLTNLIELSLDDSRVEFQPSNLYKLTSLDGFSNLTNLKSLALYGSARVNDVTFLSQMTNLTLLSFINVELTLYLDPISKLTNLTCLKLDASNGGGGDDTLRALTNLEELSVWNGSPIYDLSFLTKLKDLSLFYSFQDDITIDLTWISSLRDLEYIRIYETCTKLKSLLPLTKLPKLQYLDIEARVKDCRDVNYEDIFSNISSVELELKH